MAVDERARHQLYNRVVEVLGEEEAVILMAHLPPGGYPNFATKQDLLDLEHRLKAHTFRVVFATNLTTVGVLTAVVAALT